MLRACAGPFGPDYPTGPLVDDGQCVRTVLDCRRRAASGAAPTVLLDPTRPFDSGVVQCPPASGTSSSSGGGGSSAAAPAPVLAAEEPALLVVFHSGPSGRCRLWDPENGLLCFWNATVQRFEGTGCVYSSRVSCMCRDLPVGDFRASSAVRLRVASVRDIEQLTPAALATQLRALLALVVALFGGMLLWSAAMLAVLVSRRRAIVRELRRPPPNSCGFLQLDSGAWLWALPPVALDGPTGRLGGALVRISKAIGLPYIRLRAALPEELFRGSLLHAAGRADAMSVDALARGGSSNAAAGASGGGGGGRPVSGPRLVRGASGPRARRGKMLTEVGGGGSAVETAAGARGAAGRSPRGPAPTTANIGAALAAASSSKTPRGGNTPRGGGELSAASGAAADEGALPSAPPPAGVAAAAGDAGAIGLLASLVETKVEVGSSVLHDSEWLCGTALVFAFILAGRLLPLSEARCAKRTVLRCFDNRCHISCSLASFPPLFWHPPLPAAACRCLRCACCLLPAALARRMRR